MRKKHVTTEQFIVLVQERMARGMCYADASAPYTTDAEYEPARTAEGEREVLECDLATDENDSPLESLEMEAVRNDRYTAIGWEPPPTNPDREMLAEIDATIRQARAQTLRNAIITELTAQEQAVIYSMFWAGLSQSDIARGMRVTRQYVSMLYNRALDKLRTVFGVSGVPPVRRRRLTQEEMLHVIHTGQRRRGAAIDARLMRMNSV